MSYKNTVNKLDQRVSLVKEYQVDDGHNGVIPTRREYAQAWAYVFTGSGSENFRFNRVFAENSTVFVIRNRSDITVVQSDLVEFSGDYYNITHISKVSNREMYIAIETTLGAGF